MNFKVRLQGIFCEGIARAEGKLPLGHERRRTKSTDAEEDFRAPVTNIEYQKPESGMPCGPSIGGLRRRGLRVK